MMARSLRADGDGAGAEIALRSATDDDAPQVIDLIAACFADYPGCVMDLPGLDADLPRIASNFREQCGEFWVARAGDRLAGCAGYAPAEDNNIELKRMYVARDMRRRGIATQLLERVLAAAAQRGAAGVVLWSDTRFRAAHRFYSRHGFVQTGRTRDLNDPSGTTEYEFRLPLADAGSSAVQSSDSN